MDYEKLQKKHDLPSLEELDSIFELDKESEFILREIRRKITDRIDSFISILDGQVQLEPGARQARLHLRLRHLSARGRRLRRPFPVHAPTHRRRTRKTRRNPIRQPQTKTPTRLIQTSIRSPPQRHGWPVTTRSIGLVGRHNKSGEKPAFARAVRNKDRPRTRNRRDNPGRISTTCEGYANDPRPRF